MREVRIVDDLDPRLVSSTTKSVGSRSAPSTRFAITTSTVAMSPEVTNHFSALITKPPSLLSAVASIREGSEPAPRSVTA